MLRFTFEVDGIKQIDRGFERFTQDIKDLRPAFENMVRDFRQIERMQFESAGGRATGWQPLSPRYAAYKARRYPGQPLMVATGDLRSSLTGHTSDTIEEIEPLQLTLGTRDPKAIFHHRGTRRGLPKRPLIELTEPDKRRWTNYIHRHLVDSAKAAGLS